MKRISTLCRAFARFFHSLDQREALQHVVQQSQHNDQYLVHHVSHRRIFQGIRQLQGENVQDFAKEEANTPEIDGIGLPELHELTEKENYGLDVGRRDEIEGLCRGIVELVGLIGRIRILERFERLREQIDGEGKQHADVLGVEVRLREEHGVEASELEEMSIRNPRLEMQRGFAADFEELMALDQLFVRIRREAYAMSHAVADEDHELVEENAYLSLLRGLAF